MGGATVSDQAVKRLYVSGPMSGLPEYNFPAFTHVTSELRAAGHDVVSPHEIDHAEGCEWGEYLRRDLIEMLTCDTIVLLPGWRTSRGATLELFVATQVGMEAVEWPRLW